MANFTGAYYSTPPIVDATATSSEFDDFQPAAPVPADIGTITAIVQVALNALDVTFSDEPYHEDPFDPNDALHVPAWSLVSISPPNLEVPLVQFVEWRGSNTVRLYLDGPLPSGIMIHVQAYALAGEDTAFGGCANPIEV